VINLLLRNRVVLGLRLDHQTVKLRVRLKKLFFFKEEEIFLVSKTYSNKNQEEKVFLLKNVGLKKICSNGTITKKKGRNQINFLKKITFKSGYIFKLIS